MKHKLGSTLLAALILALLVPVEAWARGGQGGHRGGHHGSYSRGHHGGHGYYRGGHSYYRYSGHRHYYGGYRGYYPYYRGYYPYYYGFGYYRYPYARYPYYVGGYGKASEAPGGIDLNVKPKKTTQVWLDGDYVGLTKAFDGHPQYLWLPKGQYQLILFNPGHETVVRNITIYPGLVIDLDFDMVPGEATPVEELAVPKPNSEGSSQPAEGYGASAAPQGKTAEIRVKEVPGQPGRLQLDVSPADASVYLDGQFLGRGEEIAQLEAGLVIQPGDHLLEVVRPGREPVARPFRAGSGETVELAIHLTLDKG